jgi:hypothetical protein
VTIFDKKTESIIIELKKQTFEKQNEASSKSNSDVEGSDDEPGEHSEQQESSEEEDMLADFGGDGERGKFKGNEMAYKSVEIDEALMKEELFGIRATKWSIMQSIQD